MRSICDWSKHEVFATRRVLRSKTRGLAEIAKRFTRNPYARSAYRRAFREAKRPRTVGNAKHFRRELATSSHFSIIMPSPRGANYSRLANPQTTAPRFERPKGDSKSRSAEGATERSCSYRVSLLNALTARCEILPTAYQQPCSLRC